jgi:tetratricopeptide (TPR) repeat protein
MIARVSAIVLALAAPAVADGLGVPEKAKTLAEQGRALHDAGDYAGAIAAYNAAYVLAPRPGLLFNIAQAYRLSGDCDDAAFMYRRYLETNPEPNARQVAEQNLEVADKCGHGGLKIAMPTPPPTPAVTPPRDPPPPPPVQEHTEKHLGAFALVAGVGALAVAGGFAYDAHETADRVSAAYATGTVSTNLSQEDARGHRSAVIATACGVAGGAAVITGAILYAIGRRSDERQHVTVAPTTHGAEVALSWAF